MNRLDENIEIIEIDDYKIEIIECEEPPINELKEYKNNKNQTLINKIKSKLTNKKFAIVTLATITLLITLSGVFILNKSLNEKTWKKQENIVYANLNDNIEFKLNNPEYNTINVNDQYQEYGAKIIVDGIDKTKEIIIDKSQLNTKKVGTYHILYTYPININQIKTLYRTINVVDNEAPNLKLLGENVYTMLINDQYKEPGVIVSDNSNENLLDKVEIENNINTQIPGTYQIKYKVKDSSGNETIQYRTVEVKTTYETNTNTITYNSFTNTGLFISGMVQNNSFKNKILLKNKSTGNEIEVETEKNNNNYYNLSLNTTNLENGVYEFYLINNKLEPITNKMNNYSRIVRAHTGNKLITMDYSKSKVNMKVEDFKYLYDVVIDPGHGGDDTGATNGKYVERNINLEQSLYEKKRYEEHGLKVLLLRDTNNNYGITMGADDWEQIDKKGYAVGYYGTVSKIVYSNHHNSSGNETSAGWEILVPAEKTYDELKTEHTIADQWSNMYTKQINPYYRFYTKDKEEGKPNNKMNGEIYEFDDYYSVIRIPNKLFNIKNVIFEGAYINNNNDMNWYYNKENWKKLSEVKIKAYVESIGVKYIAP